jgi:hypothetical protein
MGLNTTVSATSAPSLDSSCDETSAHSFGVLPRRCKVPRVLDNRCAVAHTVHSPHAHTVHSPQSWQCGANRCALLPTRQVPLSYQLDDPNLVAIRDRYINYVLSHQNISVDGAGWLGPPITAHSVGEATCFASDPPLAAVAVRCKPRSCGRLCVAPQRCIDARSQTLYTVASWRSNWDTA